MNQHADPTPPNWQELELAETWPDSIDLKTPTGWYRLVKSVFGKRKPVCLPEALQQQYDIPKYILQEFHNLPNGNYSCRFSRGYITGFDISMLGLVQKARDWIATNLKDCSAVADVGTAGGKTAAAVKAQGVDNVWGIDPSPYLLKHAAEDHPEIHFLQGTAETISFEKNRLDGVSACFVFHELPPKHTRLAFKQFNHCLKMGGKVAISEPSEAQLSPITLKSLFTRKGWLHLYFRTLAHFVHEPFLKSWHRLNKKELGEQFGFQLVEQHVGLPINLYLFEKIKDC